MKVGVDAVLFGAWIEIPVSGRVLDVGCGTGLLSLMIAQKNPNLIVDALEIDPAAALQARENIGQSPWASTIFVHQADFFLWKPTTLFRLIVCNPPFFNPGPPTKTISRDIARNERNFPLNQFFHKAISMLLPDGDITIMLPFEKFESTCKLANENRIYLNRVFKVKPVPEKEFHRVFLQFSPIPKPLTKEEIVIEGNGRHQYSSRYIELTRDFYLKF